jgi:alpha-beta hydrolase superfamily lysophospholipase
VTAVLAAAAIGTWITTEQEIDAALLEVEPRILSYDVEVLSVTGGTVTLERTDATDTRGTWGLEWESGYARVGDVVRTRASSVTRELLETRGVLRAGVRVAVDPFAYESDPDDVGIPFSDVDVPGPLGEYPAWRIDGSDDTWILFVHDRGSYRREALRMLSTVHALGFPALVVTYRNDPAAPPSPNQRYSLGRHEWRDLEAAVDYAVASGAADVVLVGFGMGGSASALLVRESESASRVRALVLDAPLLDPAAVVADAAAARNIPPFIVTMAKGLAGLRYGIDWTGLDQVRHAEDLEVPILLFHGVADDEVPIRSSDRFAEAASTVAGYERALEAGHGEAWNVDPAGYEDAVTLFLTEVALGAAPAGPAGRQAGGGDPAGDRRPFGADDEVTAAGRGSVYGGW